MCRARAESHVRVTIVQREDAPPIVDNEDRTVATVHNEPALRLQIIKAAGERKFLVRCVHKHAFRNRLVRAAMARIAYDALVRQTGCKPRPAVRP